MKHFLKLNNSQKMPSKRPNFKSSQCSSHKISTFSKSSSIIFGLCFIFGIFISYIFLVPMLEEENIKKQIDEANYCTQDLDCKDAGSKCPFDCYVYVNKAEVNKISKLIENFESKCVYNCIQCQSAVCVENKCRPKCDY